MSQTLSYDNTGTDQSANGKIYDLDFFPGSVFDSENLTIDLINLDLTKMVLYVTTAQNRTVFGAYKKENQTWEQATIFSEGGGRLKNEEDFQLTETFIATSKTLELDGLELNTKYDFRIKSIADGSNGESYGNYIYAKFTTFYPIGDMGIARIESFTNQSLLAPVISDQVVDQTLFEPWLNPWNYKESDVKDFWQTASKTQKLQPKEIANTSKVENKEISGSVFTLENPQLVDNQVALCTKTLDISLYETSSTYDPSITPPIVFNYYKYFIFGTKIFFSDYKDKVKSPQGGITFFSTPSGSSGYGILIKSTRSNTGTKDEVTPPDITIIKIGSSGKLERLPDNQGKPRNAFVGVYTSEEYLVTIMVDCSDPTKNIIRAYINGFEIIATDNDPLSPTKTIGMFTMKGKTSFDYIYAYPLFKEQYDKIKPGEFLIGKAPFEALSVSYGNKLINNNSQEFDGYYEEFGPVAKEIIYLEEKFDQPTYPVLFSTGVNKYVQILYQKTNNFGFKAYLINNASKAIPLVKSDENISLFMVGGSVISGETSEYKTDKENKYVNDREIILDSTWIQKKTDAEKMANWLKEQWSKNSIFVTMQVFGNPFISVGDIVTISYPRTGINETQKYLVTSVQQSFDGGLETTLKCRSINSYS